MGRSLRIVLGKLRAVFGSKKGGHRYQGEVTKRGKRAFERRRKEVADYCGVSPKRISDGDVFEFCALWLDGQPEQNIIEHRLAWVSANKDKRGATT